MSIQVKSVARPMTLNEALSAIPPEGSESYEQIIGWGTPVTSEPDKKYWCPTPESLWLSRAAAVMDCCAKFRRLHPELVDRLGELDWEFTMEYRSQEDPMNRMVTHICVWEDGKKTSWKKLSNTLVDPVTSLGRKTEESEASRG